MGFFYAAFGDETAMGSVLNLSGLGGRPTECLCVLVSAWSLCYRMQLRAVRKNRKKRFYLFLCDRFLIIDFFGRRASDARLHSSWRSSSFSQSLLLHCRMGHVAFWLHQSGTTYSYWYQALQVHCQKKMAHKYLSPRIPNACP